MGPHQMHQVFGLPTISEVDDDDAAMPFVVHTLGLAGRLVNLERELQTRLLGVCLSPLSLFAAANLLDDERG